MIDDSILEYAAAQLRKKIHKRFVVQKICVWYTPESWNGSLNLRVDYSPANPRTYPAHFDDHTELVNIPGGLLKKLPTDTTHGVLDLVTDIMARRVESLASRVVEQTGVVEVVPTKAWQAKKKRRGRK